MTKLLYCWRCQMDIPMLEDHEASVGQWDRKNVAVVQCRIKGSRRPLGLENRSDLKTRPRSRPARPSLQITPSLGHPGQVAWGEARQPE
jgi:hypothetical protein